MDIKEQIRVLEAECDSQVRNVEAVRDTDIARIEEARDRAIEQIKVDAESEIALRKDYAQQEIDGIKYATQRNKEEAVANEENLVYLRSQQDLASIQQAA